MTHGEGKCKYLMGYLPINMLPGKIVIAIFSWFDTLYNVLMKDA
jgi:hypothetical protein